MFPFYSNNQESLKMKESLPGLTRQGTGNCWTDGWLQSPFPHVALFYLFYQEFYLMLTSIISYLFARK